MTLVVAAVEGEQVWVLSDTLVTGGTLSVREREYVVKTELSIDDTFFVAFAGGAELGRAAIIHATTLDQLSAVRYLSGISDKGGVEFGLGSYSNEPHLFHISGGRASEVRALHLGSHAAFEAFQKVRLGDVVSHAPLAMRMFVAGAAQTLPEGLNKAISAMIDTFAAHSDRDIGGWPVPHFVDSSGAYTAAYLLSVSDPIFDQLMPGDIVPHGSSQLGGMTLSFTPLEQHKGWAVYWLQLPGGRLHLRNADGSYRDVKVAGLPSSFIAEATVIAECPVTLMIGDKPAGPLRKLSISLDQSGLPAFATGTHDGGVFTQSVLNTATPFKGSGALDRSEDIVTSLTSKVEMKLSSSETLSINLKGAAAVSLSAEETDELIDGIANARSSLRDAVSLEFPSGMPLRITEDPKWKVFAKVHSDLNGVLLCLRSPGLGWQAYHLPPREAQSLGKWLVANTTAPVPAPE